MTTTTPIAPGTPLGAVLAQRAAALGDETFMVFLGDDGSETVLTYRALYRGAKQVAAGLQARGIKPGDRVMLGLTTGPAYLDVFYGILLTGAVAVPYPPPARPEQLEAILPLHARVEPALVVATPEAAPYFAAAGVEAVTAEAIAADEAGFTALEVAPDSLALIQGTSGSTQAPKPVMLSHRAVLAAMHGQIHATPIGPEDVFVLWAPFTHNMGLLVTVKALVAGARYVVLNPFAVMADPKRWVQAIDRYRGTVSGGSNFAFQLLVDGPSDEDLEGLDLSCWRTVGLGSEPVRFETLDAFARRYGPLGFERNRFRTAYGSTEMTLGISITPANEPIAADRVDADLLEREGRAEPAAPEARSSTFVSAGVPFAGYEARILADGVIQPERSVGELQVRGPSMMSGYWGDPEATAAAFDDGWLRTGDLAYLAGGEIFIVGRLKDMIVKGGRKYTAHDVEAFAARAPGLRPAGLVAFGVPDAETGTEAVVLVAETEAPAEEHPAIARAVSKAVWDGLNLSLDRVVLVAPGTISRTATQKIQRAQVRALYQQGAIQ